MKLPRKSLAAIIVAILIGLTVAGGISMSSSTGETVLPVVTAVAGEAPTISKPEGTAPAELTTKDVIVGSSSNVNAHCALHTHGVVNRKNY
jgi:peptidylprolyl isomerase